VRARVAAGLWLLVGVVVWNGFFDLYVSRGATEYLRRQAEFELGRGPEPSMAQVMREASRDGAEAAALWAALIVAGGWLTLWAGIRSR
jgi:hypothetical protein